jgi:hypothetical protein
MANSWVEAVASGASEMGDLPLGIEVNIDDIEYARIIRRIATADRGADTVVSAFNSSI